MQGLEPHIRSQMMSTYRTSDTVIETASLDGHSQEVCIFSKHFAESHLTFISQSLIQSEELLY